MKKIATMWRFYWTSFQRKRKAQKLVWNIFGLSETLREEQLVWGGKEVCAPKNSSTDLLFQETLELSPSWTSTEHEQLERLPALWRMKLDTILVPITMKTLHVGFKASWCLKLSKTMLSHFLCAALSVSEKTSGQHWTQTRQTQGGVLQLLSCFGSQEESTVFHQQNYIELNCLESWIRSNFQTIIIYQNSYYRTENKEICCIA